MLKSGARCSLCSCWHNFLRPALSKDTARGLATYMSCAHTAPPFCQGKRGRPTHLPMYLKRQLAGRTAFFYATFGGCPCNLWGC